LNFSLYSPGELCRRIGERARELRLASGQRQADVAEKAGIPLSTLKRFERTGEVGLHTVVRIALALGAEDGFAALFPPRERRSLDEIVAANRVRQRVRRPR
jgi:transcriptional regulator with XRE-family HTH domain